MAAAFANGYDAFVFARASAASTRGVMPGNDTAGG